MLRYRSNEDVKPVIDNNDTSVTYSGDWRTGSAAATYFQAYGSTLHYTLQPNANASISFYGSYITVFGIIPSNFDVKNAGFTIAGPQVQSSYQFDNGPVESFIATLGNEHFTDQVFFQPSTTQSEGHHTLVITNLVGIITLDYFTIVPANSGSSPYIQKIDDASPNITYHNAKPFSNTIGADHNSTLHSLSSTYSTASLDFNGNFVAVYGALPVGNSLPNVSFTLDSVDQSVPTGQSDPSGSMPRLPTFRKQRLSQVLFWKSSTLGNGQHNLLITARQGEFLLDFILIQTLNGVGSGTTSSSQSLQPTTPYVPSSSSSTNAPPYGSGTSSSSASRSLPTGAPSDHTKNTSVIVGGSVGGVVGFIVLLLVFWILFKWRSGLRSKTQSDSEPSSQPLIQAGLPVATIATAGTPYLVDGSGQVVMGLIVGSSLMSVPPPYQPRYETQERQVVPAEMNEGGKDVAQEVQYGHDDKFAAFGQVQTDRLV